MADIMTLKQRAYEFIQGKLLTGEWTGGNLISEHAVAEQVGISRTPVREAIHQLELEGFLERVPRYGTLVRAPDHEEIRELFDLREALETYAAAEAASYLLPTDREMLQALLAEMQTVAREMREQNQDFLDENGLRRFLTADIGFHMTLMRSANNRRFMKILADFRVLQRIFGYHRVRHGVDIVEEACRQHDEILGAICQGDAEQVRVAVTKHIRASKAHSLDALDVRATHRGTAEENLPPLPADLLRDIRELSGVKNGSRPAAVVGTK